MGCTADEVALPKATVNKFVNEIAGGLGTCFPASVFLQLRLAPELSHIAPFCCHFLFHRRRVWGTWPGRVLTGLATCT